MMDRAQFMQELYFFVLWNSWRSCLLIFPRQRGRMPLIFIIVISMMQELRMKLRCSGNLEVQRRLQRSSRRI